MYRIYKEFRDISENQIFFSCLLRCCHIKPLSRVEFTRAESSLYRAVSTTTLTGVCFMVINAMVMDDKKKPS